MTSSVHVWSLCNINADLFSSLKEQNNTTKEFNVECTISHYENLSMQYRQIFKSVKIEKFQYKIFDIFPIFAPKQRLWDTLKLPHRGGSIEYPQSMFWSKNKENRYTPAYPSFSI